MIRLLLAAILALLAAAAQAHETTRSYLALEREGTAVSARLSLAFRDVEVVAWMDEDLDGRITWGEARGRQDEAASYAAARLALRAGGACALAPAGAGPPRAAAWVISTSPSRRPAPRRRRPWRSPPRSSPRSTPATGCS